MNIAQEPSPTQEYSFERPRFRVRPVWVLVFFLAVALWGSLVPPFESSAAAVTPQLDYATTAPAAVGDEADELATARAEMNRLGGGNVKLVLGVEEGCRKILVRACVWPSDGPIIYISESSAQEDTYTLRGLLAHEFAHIVTTVWADEFDAWSTPAFKLFDGDFELMADCMAISKVGYTVTGYGSVCTGGMLSAADKLWDGNWY